MRTISLSSMFFYWLIRLSLQDISFLKQQNLEYSNDRFFSMHSTKSHVIWATRQPGHGVTVSLFSTADLSPPRRLAIPKLPFDRNSHFRTAQLNTYSTLPDISLLYFTSTQLLYFPTYQPQYRQIYRAEQSEIIIKSAQFGKSKQNIYLLMEKSSNKFYWIYFFTEGKLMKKIQLPFSGQADDLHQFRVDSGRLVFLWSSRLEIYGFEDGVLGGRIFYDSFASMEAEFVDVKVEGELVAYAVGCELRVYNLTTLACVAKYTCAEMINSISIFGDYIVIKTTAAIRQYDYQVGMVISSLPQHSQHPHKIYALYNNRIIHFADNHQFQILSITQQYKCMNCNACARTYYTSKSQCIKNNNSKNTSNTRILATLSADIQPAGTQISDMPYTDQISSDLTQPTSTTESNTTNTLNNTQFNPISNNNTISNNTTLNSIFIQPAPNITTNNTTSLVVSNVSVNAYINTALNISNYTVSGDLMANSTNTTSILVSTNNTNYTINNITINAAAYNSTINNTGVNNNTSVSGFNITSNSALNITNISGLNTNTNNSNNFVSNSTSTTSMNTMNNMSNTSTINNITFINNTTANISNNLTNTSMMNNNSIPFINNNSYPAPNINNNSSINNELIVVSQENSTVYTHITIKILSIFVNKGTSYISSVSTIKSMPKFLLVFNVLINDLIFYKYHRKFQPMYPNSVLVFMEQFDLMKELGINPFLSYLDFFSDSQRNLSPKNQEMLRNLEFTSHDPEEVYFLYQLSGFYRSNIFITFLFFILLKIVHLLLYLAKGKHKVFKKCYKFIRFQSRWWTLVVAVIEMNIAEIFFECSLQFLQLQSGCVLDKLNLIAMLSTFFLIIFYSLSFYSLVYAKDSIRSSKNLIVYEKPKKMKSYFLEPLLFLVRGNIKSFIHGFLINSYPTQIILLFLVDVIFVIICVVMVRNFCNKFVGFLAILYLLGLTMFDLYFVLELHTAISALWDRQLIGFILCFALAALLLMLLTVFLISSILAVFKFIKKALKKKTEEEKDEKCQNSITTYQIKKQIIKLNKITNDNNLEKQEACSIFIKYIPKNSAEQGNKSKKKKKTQKKIKQKSNKLLKNLQFTCSKLPKEKQQEKIQNSFKNQINSASTASK